MRDSISAVRAEKQIAKDLIALRRERQWAREWLERAVAESFDDCVLTADCLKVLVERIEALRLSDF